MVPTYGGYAEIMHRNQAVEDNYYLIEAGDTVLFTYGENLRPQIRSLRSERNTRLYHIAEDDPRAIHLPTGYSLQSITDPFSQYVVLWKMLNKYQNDPAKKETYEKYQALCPNIDSLRAIYDAYRTDYVQRLDTLENGGYITPRYADFLRGRDQLDNVDTTAATLRSDSLMHYPFAHRLARRLIPQTFTLADCQRVAADTTLSKYARAAALRFVMGRMATNDAGWMMFPAELVNQCNEIYIALTGDRSYTPEVVIGKTHLENGYSNDLVLEDVEGNRFDYADILHQHRGEVVYIDFWASWCTPCRAEMPQALKLRKEYASKEVIFVYLAVGDTRDKWRRAVRECETSKVGGINYIVLNYKESKFLHEIQQRRIPHMILYDRTGKLVDADAPRPESQEI
ncbi:MAG: TlpA disulfide reductase family protein, partial [Alistipes sp.]